MRKKSKKEEEEEEEFLRRETIDFIILPVFDLVTFI